jgi:hypothetical protein
VGEAPGCLSERAHYVEVPDHEGPRDGDRPQRLRREMSLCGVELASCRCFRPATYQGEYPR